MGASGAAAGGGMASGVQTGTSGMGVGLGANAPASVAPMTGSTPWNWQGGMDAGMPLIQGGLSKAASPGVGGVITQSSNLAQLPELRQMSQYGYQMPIQFRV